MVLIFPQYFEDTIPLFSRLCCCCWDVKYQFSWAFSIDNLSLLSVFCNCTDYGFFLLWDSFFSLLPGCSWRKLTIRAEFPGSKISFLLPGLIQWESLVTDWRKGEIKIFLLCQLGLHFQILLLLCGDPTGSTGLHILPLHPLPLLKNFWVGSPYLGSLISLFCIHHIILILNTVSCVFFDWIISDTVFYISLWCL